MDEFITFIIGLIAGLVFGSLFGVSASNDKFQQDCDTMRQSRIGDAVYRCEKQP